MSRCQTEDPLSQVQYVDFKTYLPGDILTKVDRASMANSLEARSPLLDTALVEYAVSMPDRYKLRRGRTKTILRDAFADLIPPQIARRPKTGFGVPLDAWFRGELRDRMRDALLSPSAASRPFLRRAAIQRVVDAHLSGEANNGHRLWTLLCFESWLRRLPEWSAPAPPFRADPPSPLEAP